MLPQHIAYLDTHLDCHTMMIVLPTMCLYMTSL